MSKHCEGRGICLGVGDAHRPQGRPEAYGRQIRRLQQLQRRSLYFWFQHQSGEQQVQLKVWKMLQDWQEEKKTQR